MNPPKGLTVVLGTTFLAGALTTIADIRGNIVGNVAANPSVMKIYTLDTITALASIIVFVSLCAFVMYSHKTHK